VNGDLDEANLRALIEGDKGIFGISKGRISDGYEPTFFRETGRGMHEKWHDHRRSYPLATFVARLAGRQLLQQAIELVPVRAILGPGIGTAWASRADSE
jgi:hypothetical protein